MNRKTVSIALVATLTTFLVLQLLPIGIGHTNPPVQSEPAWDSPQTRVLAERACYDCHSNETKWPWYSQIAPISWSVMDHVAEGREKLNFSTGGTGEEAHEAGEEVLDGEMPPTYYTLLHPEARLTDAEKATLVAGLNATLGGEEGDVGASRANHAPGAAVAGRHEDDDDEADEDDDD